MQLVTIHIPLCYCLAAFFVMLLNGEYGDYILLFTSNSQGSGKHEWPGNEKLFKLFT